MPEELPQGYNEELVRAVCTRISEGESLRSICRAPGMPPKATWFYWLHKYPDVVKLYQEALRARADVFVEDMLDIADDASNDWMERNDPNNRGWLANHDNINRSRLRVDTRKWIAARMFPKKYGDRLAVTGHEDAPPVMLAHLPADPKAAMDAYLAMTRGAAKEMPTITDESDPTEQGDDT